MVEEQTRGKDTISHGGSESQKDRTKTLRRFNRHDHFSAPPRRPRQRGSLQSSTLLLVHRKIV
jgi:hypothetical protein